MPNKKLSRRSLLGRAMIAAAALPVSRWSAKQWLPRRRRWIQPIRPPRRSQNDTPAELQRFAHERHIDSPRWILARASAEDVRLLAAALGIRYRELPDHSFNHSTVISLLDQEGVARAKTLGVQATDDSFLKSLKSLSASVTARLAH